MPLSLTLVLVVIHIIYSGVYNAFLDLGWGIILSCLSVAGLIFYVASEIYLFLAAFLGGSRYSASICICFCRRGGDISVLDLQFLFDFLF